ncbi:hypothetical protein ABBQ32_001477 [Trebouxia sp. C0010 RCD-2024]
MALIARRKLVQLREDAVDEVDLPSFATRLEGHCRSLGCAISRGQQPHIRLRQRHGPERQARPCKRVQSRTASSPFASMTFATVPQNVCSTGGTHIHKKQVPHFTLASADESKVTTATDVAKVTGAPAWRVVLGNVAAGATAGCAVEAALYPIDTIKTRLQLMLRGGGFKALVKQGGAKNLYAGVWGNLAGVAPASAVFMAIYEPVKAALNERVPENKSFLAPLGAGSAAGLAASVIRVPTEVVKQRLQSGEFTKGAADAVQSILKTEGVRGMFAGYGSFIIRDLPFDAIEFVAYEQLKKAWMKYTGADIRPHESAVIGALAGSITGVATTPLDVIKTRLMTQGSKRTYTNVFDCASKIAQQEGYATFLQGWQPRVVWIGLGGCVFFTALEEAKKFYAPKPVAQKLGTS